MQQQAPFIQLLSAPMQVIYNTIQQVGRSNSPFFITGETGVGKEGVARYIHESRIVGSYVDAEGRFLPQGAVDFLLTFLFS